MKYLKTYEDFLKPEVENNEVTEMGLHDWKVELILATYNKADAEGKKAMAKTITGKESSNLAKIVSELRSLTKPGIDELTTELGLDEQIKEGYVPDPAIWFMLGQNSHGGGDPVSTGTAIALILGALAVTAGGAVAVHWDEIKDKFAKWKKQRRLDKVDKDFSEEDLKQILMTLQSTHSDIYQLIKSNKAADQIISKLKETEMGDVIDPDYAAEFIRRLKEASRKK